MLFCTNKRMFLANNWLPWSSCQHLQNYQALPGQISYLRIAQWLPHSLCYPDLLRSKWNRFFNVSRTFRSQKLPAFTMDWLEILPARSSLFQVPHWYTYLRNTRDKSFHELKAASLDDRKTGQTGPQQNKTSCSTNPSWKLNAVREISRWNTRLLEVNCATVCTDYIRQDFSSSREIRTHLLTGSASLISNLFAGKFRASNSFLQCLDR